MKIDEASNRLVHTPMLHLRIDTFRNNDHCEQCTRFAKSELHNLIGRLALKEHVCVLNCPGIFFRFYREVFLLYALIKLGDGLPHTAMCLVVILIGGNVVITT